MRYMFLNFHGNHSTLGKKPLISIAINILLNRYAEVGKPLVIRNATLDWRMMTELNFQWLKKTYLRYFAN